MKLYSNLVIYFGFACMKFDFRFGLFVVFLGSILFLFFPKNNKKLLSRLKELFELLFKNFVGKLAKFLFTLE